MNAHPPNGFEYISINLDVRSPCILQQHVPSNIPMFRIVISPKNGSVCACVYAWWLGAFFEKKNVDPVGFFVAPC